VRPEIEGSLVPNNLKLQIIINIFVTNSMERIMRISVTEREVISSSAKQIFGSDTKVVLFGSRANDASRGGDIDLLIIPPDDSVRTEFFNKKFQFIFKVLDKIGDQKIDVIIKYPDDKRGIIQTALNEGVRIC